MLITLTQEQAEKAGSIGLNRMLSSIYQKRTQTLRGDNRPEGERWYQGIQAAAAEYAVVLALRKLYPDVHIKWTGSPVNKELSFIPPVDVGSKTEVRYTEKPTNRLLIYQKEDYTKNWVLVVGRIPEFRIAGWVTFSKQEELSEDWLEEHRPGGKCYYIPHRVLQPIETLKPEDI